MYIFWLRFIFERLKPVLTTKAPFEFVSSCCKLTKVSLWSKTVKYLFKSFWYTKAIILYFEPRLNICMLCMYCEYIQTMYDTYYINRYTILLNHRVRNLSVVVLPKKKNSLKIIFYQFPHRLLQIRGLFSVRQIFAIILESYQKNQFLAML